MYLKAVISSNTETTQRSITSITKRGNGAHINYQLSIINYQLLIINYQLLINTLAHYYITTSTN